MSLLLADCVAKRFCASECARLFQDQGSRRKVDSRIHSPRFDCCAFLFYSFSAVTFAQSARRVTSLWCQMTDAIGAKRTCGERRDHVGLTRMTQPRRWLCAAPIVSVPIKVPVSADTMLSSELGNRYAATQVHHAGRRHCGGLAACGARAAAGE